MNVEEARKMADTALQQLAAALERGESEMLKAYLAAMAKFPRYSPNNVWLILGQRPTATQVAGYTTWRRLGRQVKRGARGIGIIAPILHWRADDGSQSGGHGNDDEVLAFCCAYVFDVSDTQGAPLPLLSSVRGDPGPYTDRLVAFAASKGIKLEYSRRFAPALGACIGDTVVLLPDLSPPENLSTLAHEVGHALLHSRDVPEPLSRTVRETEAEAVAFVVCQAIGLDSLTASSDYLTLYQGDTKTLAASLERIQRTAGEIIAAIGPDV